MPLINLSKEELKKVEYYLLGDTDPLIVSVLEKIRSLDEVCECNNTSNVSTTGVEMIAGGSNEYNKTITLIEIGA